MPEPFQGSGKRMQSVSRTITNRLRQVRCGRHGVAPQAGSFPGFWQTGEGGAARVPLDGGGRTSALSPRAEAEYELGVLAGYGQGYGKRRAARFSLRDTTSAASRAWPLPPPGSTAERLRLFAHGSPERCERNLERVPRSFPTR